MVTSNFQDPQLQALADGLSAWLASGLGIVTFVVTVFVFMKRRAAEALS